MSRTVDITQEPEGWRLVLDGKSLSTPKRIPLHLPTQALAEAMVAEWRNAKGFSTATMPITAMAFTAVDIAREYQGRMVEAMLAFADTDLVLYRSEASALRARQEKFWNPVLEWLAKRFGVMPRVTTGVMPVTQPGALIDALRETMAQFDAFTMAGFSVLTQNLGSLFLALTVKEKILEPHDAFTRSRIDEDYQAEIWGEDSVNLARARAIARDVEAAAKFLELLA